MKKITLWLIISSMALTMVGCGNSNTNNDDSQTTTSQSDTVTQETTIEDITNADETSNETTSIEDTSANGNTQNTGDIDLQAIVDEITSKEDWASLMKIEDASVISEFFTLDADNPNYKQLLVMQCPMSAIIAEIIIIETDDTASAMEDLNARKDKLINSDAFYPEHQEIAKESIVGSHGNIAYFIAGEEAEDSEEVLVNYLDSLS